MNINITVDSPQGDVILHILRRIEDKMSKISDAVDAIFAEVDTSSNVIKAELETLIALVADGTITPDELQAKAQPMLDKLAEMGTLYTNPVPE
jgi:hypothetical protein